MVCKIRLYGLFYCVIFPIVFSTKYSQEEGFCSSEGCGEDSSFTRYLLYDVNYPEGFNLRRDVYMRYAVLARYLKLSRNPDLYNFKLVLPPWSHLVHWNYSTTPEYIPWSTYFDLESLQSFAPVVEISDLFEALREGGLKALNIEEVYILQHFEEMFATGKFEDKMSIDQCINEPRLSYFFYHNISSNDIKCLSFHGATTKLIELIEKTKAKTILLDHAEIALHPMYGDKTFWMARRSMRFNKELVEIATEFRKLHLNSSDIEDNSIRPDNWRDEKPGRKAIGGPYLAIHLRRRDFIRSRPDESPTLESVAKQIDTKLNELGLKVVFIATDAPNEEFNKIESLLSDKKVVRYVPSEEVLKKFKDGGVAIIDQIICSHAKYFIGTYESTFSFRIQEEREIIGFPVESTFNCLCKDDKKCNQSSVWKIVY